LRLSEDPLLVSAVGVGDGVVVAKVGHLGAGGLDLLAPLHVEPSDFGQVAIVGSISGYKLSNHSEGQIGVDCEVGACTVELFVAVPERVQIAAVFVADSVLPLAAISALTLLTSVVAWGFAGMGSVGIGSFVGLPDIEFSTAAAVVALVVLPVFGVGLSPDELDVVWALGVTVASAILGSSLVGGVFGLASVSLHLDEVEGSVDATLQG